MILAGCQYQARHGRRHVADWGTPGSHHQSPQHLPLGLPCEQRYALLAGICSAAVLVATKGSVIALHSESSAGLKRHAVCARLGEYPMVGHQLFIFNVILHGARSLQHSFSPSFELLGPAMCRKLGLFHYTLHDSCSMHLVHTASCAVYCRKAVAAAPKPAAHLVGMWPERRCSIRPGCQPAQH